MEFAEFLRGREEAELILRQAQDDGGLEGFVQVLGGLSTLPGPRS